MSWHSLKILVELLQYLVPRMNSLWVFHIALAHIYFIMVMSADSLDTIPSVCKSDQDCPERETCRLLFSMPTCLCSHGHERDPQGRCIERCDTKPCNYTGEQCFAYENTRRCLCPYNYEWSNEHQGCRALDKYEWDPIRNISAKICRSDDDCNINREICSATFINTMCQCKPDYTWDAVAQKCRKTTELFKRWPPADEEMDNLCKEFDCSITARGIRKNMDFAVQPCDNFYKFACGGYLKNTNLGAGETFRTIERKGQSNIVLQMYSAMKEPSPANEPEFIRTIKTFYNSCMNEVAIEQRGLDPLQKKLKQLGGWPVVDGEDWNGANFDWIGSMHEAHMAELPSNYFFTLGISAHSKNSTMKSLYCYPPSLGISREALMMGLNDTKVEAYYKLMVDVAVLLGASRDKATVELRKSLEFEMSLAKILPSAVKQRNVTALYNPMTITELSQKYPSIPWKNCINNILAPYVTVDDNETVIVSDPEYMSELVKLIKTTEKRVQANYMVWRTIKTVASLFDESIRKIISEYDMATAGSTFHRQNRYMYCVQITQQALITSNALYVRKFIPDIRNATTEIVINIRHQLNNILQTIDWMDDETKKKALVKADAILAHVGYPNEFMDDTVMNAVYKDLTLNVDNYFENLLSTRRFLIDEETRKFREPIDKNHWTQHAAVANANAFYNPSTNSINILAGILQGAYLSNNFYKYMNYGDIGFIVGHELTHALSDLGGQYDQYGNLGDWWSPDTDKEYKKRAQCIVDQYNSYNIEEIGKKLNGVITQGENIADIGGYKLAYLAYRDWSKKHGEEQGLIGFQFNPQQMFWITAAQVMCTKYSPKYLENAILNEPHSPNSIRIFASFGNLPEFARDFNCPVGSMMNPKHQCTFW